ncbi:MAG: LytTR family DNA-binding domain-containing protein [Bacteroidota bacterium]
MIRALVIDDEGNARFTLSNYLTTYCPEVTILGEADSVESGFLAINKYQPDVVFLDIMLSDGSGFNLLNRFENINFKVVFVTSFSQYAIKALKYSAFDYILKPIDIDELLTVVNRLKSIIETSSDTGTKLDFLEKSMTKEENKFTKIVLATNNSLYVVEIADIIHCEAQESYTMFHLANDTRLMVSKTLKEYEELLQEHLFVRIHKSHLVNFNFITRFLNQDGGSVVLKNGATVPVSFRKKDIVVKLITDMGLK